ncbi:unnamed protein product [Closterium sp. NIES-54]
MPLLPPPPPPFPSHALNRVEFDEASYEIRALRSRFDSPRNVLPHTPSTTPSPCFAFNRVEFDEAAYEIRALRSRFESPLLRYSFSSLVNPTTVFERDMDTDRQAARKVDWFRPATVVAVVTFTAKDGTQVPISLVHRNTPANVAGAPSVSTDAAACSGPPWPMLLYAYGAYEVRVGAQQQQTALQCLQCCRCCQRPALTHAALCLWRI